ncbi:SSU ribosomal protein S9P [Rhodocollybia butyracea]|uniref:SSU ribosomal protein S9P n=1 Tax=Rhodocollybia butyracea TaxID=206335 RepID=A0A9P5PC77_9AGAR|nr:SSU ribosomal protein S9P [Rhodocollybia butyracea]
MLRSQVFAVLRRPLFYRFVSTTRSFIPPSQLNHVGESRPRRSGVQELDAALMQEIADEVEAEEEDLDEIDEKPKPHPESPSFYTGRASYYDNLIELQNAISSTRGTLKRLHLLPLPEFARKSLIPMPTVWKTPREMTVDFETTITISRYRKVIALLNELNEYLRIATTAGYEEIADKISGIVTIFESGKKDAILTRGIRKPIELDRCGRSYTSGRRKTSTARVWMIPVKESPQEEDVDVEEVFGLPQSQSKAPAVNVSVSTILINNFPIVEYFPQPVDRERLVRPLKIAGVLGKYNIFTLVRGGGTTGQSGAIAHGIAKGIFAHEPETGTVLRKAKLLRRDPRMVERKKTGLAKARKAYTWVKR